MAVFLSKSAAETFRIAQNYARTLRPGDVVLLNGEMSAGKTVFAKAGAFEPSGRIEK